MAITQTQQTNSYGLDSFMDLEATLKGFKDEILQPLYKRGVQLGATTFIERNSCEEYLTNTNTFVGTMDGSKMGFIQAVKRRIKNDLQDCLDNYDCKPMYYDENNDFVDFTIRFFDNATDSASPYILELVIEYDSWDFFDTDARIICGN